MEQNEMIVATEKKGILERVKENKKKLAIFAAAGVGLVLTGFLLGKSKADEDGEFYDDQETLDGDEFISDGPEDE